MDNEGVGSGRWSATAAAMAILPHVRSIFTKLDLSSTADDHRRVLAVLAYLGSDPGGP